MSNSYKRDVLMSPGVHELIVNHQLSSDSVAEMVLMYDSSNGTETSKSVELKDGSAKTLHIQLYNNVLYIMTHQDVN